MAASIPGAHRVAVDTDRLHVLARVLRRNSTDVERRLWRELRSRRFLRHKFRRQHIVGPFIADFCCPARSLIIELDGGQHAVRATEDADRTRYLSARGYRVVRFWNNDVLCNLPGVLQTISEALESPSPQPSPR